MKRVSIGSIPGILGATTWLSINKTIEWSILTRDPRIEVNQAPLGDWIYKSYRSFNSDVGGFSPTHLEKYAQVNMGWTSSPKDRGWTLKKNVFLSCHHLGLDCFFPKVPFFRVTWFQRPPGWWLPQVSSENNRWIDALENRETGEFAKGYFNLPSKSKSLENICNK